MSTERQPKKTTARHLPLHADYSDEVTSAHIERLKTLAPEEKYKDAKMIDGPAW